MRLVERLAGTPSALHRVVRSTTRPGAGSESVAEALDRQRAVGEHRHFAVRIRETDGHAERSHGRDLDRPLARLVVLPATVTHRDLHARGPRRRVHEDEIGLRVDGTGRCEHPVCGRVPSAERRLAPRARRGAGGSGAFGDDRRVRVEHHRECRTDRRRKIDRCKLATPASRHDEAGAGRFAIREQARHRQDGLAVRGVLDDQRLLHRPASVDIREIPAGRRNSGPTSDGVVRHGSAGRAKAIGTLRQNRRSAANRHRQVEARDIGMILVHPDGGALARRQLDELVRQDRVGRANVGNVGDHGRHAGVVEQQEEIHIRACAPVGEVPRARRLLNAKAGIGQLELRRLRRRPAIRLTLDRERNLGFDGHRHDAIGDRRVRGLAR